MTHEAEIIIELYRRKNIDFISLSKKQQEAFLILIDNDIKEFLYGGGAGGGKTWLGCSWLILNCEAYAGTKWFIGRKSLKDLEGSVLISIYKVCDHYGFDRPVYNGQKNIFTFANGSKIDFKDCRYNPSDAMYERLGSIEYTGGWIEEGGEVPFDAYDTLKTRIGRHLNLNYCSYCGTYHKNPKLSEDKSLLYCMHCQQWSKGLVSKLFITCNPKKNWMYKYFYKPFKENILKPTRKFVAALVQDNPYIGKDYIDNLINTTDKSKKERLLYGNWEYDDDPMWLIENYDKLLDMFSQRNKDKGTEQYISIDAARFGSDKAILGRWKDWDCVEIFIFDISKTTDISKKAKEWESNYNIPRSHTVVDSDGVGGGVADELEGCVNFKNNGTPIEVHKKNKEEYQNLQTQCAFFLANVINDAILTISARLSENQKADMIEELEQLKRLDTDSKLRLISKDTIKQNIGRSPDYRDMMLMRCYYGVKNTDSYFEVYEEPEDYDDEEEEDFY